MQFIAILCLSIISTTVVAGENFLPPSLMQVSNEVPETRQTLGVVEPTFRCGGFGTPLAMRISDCEGYCTFEPGKVYHCEKDFMPSSAAQELSLLIEVCNDKGACFRILQTEIPNSSIQPGFVYTTKYSIVPNDGFSGQTVEFKAFIYHTQGNLLEICVGALVDIL